MSGVRCHLSGVMCNLVNVGNVRKGNIKSHLSGVMCNLLGVRCHLSCVTCHISGVMSQVPCVRCQLSGVRCHVSPVKCQKMKQPETLTWNKSQQSYQLGNMFRIDQEVMLQWPKFFLEIGYGLCRVFGLFLLGNSLGNTQNLSFTLWSFIVEGVIVQL